MKQPSIISHNNHQKNLQETITQIKTRISSQSQQSNLSVEQQTKLVDELAAFPFGQFLLLNGGWNGFWTDYVMSYAEKREMSNHDSQGSLLTDLELKILNQYPTVLATQERFKHFRRVIQQHLQDGVIFASLPCGLMRDLLGLDFSQVKNFKLVGIDLDSESLNLAQQLASEYGLLDKVEFHQADAWNLGFSESFHLLTSNGLNIYESDDEQVIELYDRFWQALVPGGILVTSFLTPPPNLDPNSEWNLNHIDPQILLEQKIVFVDILEGKFQNFRSSSTTKLQLEKAGFTNIEFIGDQGKIFPTVVARKP